MTWVGSKVGGAGNPAARFQVRPSEALAAIVASTFSVSRDAIGGRRRGPAQTAFARQVAIYLSHTRLGLTYAEAGACFGRDRTTAAYACRKVEERRDDPRIDAVVDLLERAIDVCPGLAEAGSR